MANEEGSENPWVFEGRHIGASLKTNKICDFRLRQKWPEVAGNGNPDVPIVSVESSAQLGGLPATIQPVPAYS
ncbi:hypothetical protein AMTR_s00033p00141770 [Amborella trichopoda]|uniref:Uncharacterized protein n=1 Tax=Amborella trichopoda TaxID=13333 RepID=U5CM86_AMBTC|nr:hypothetical protein AMTR_s00033p00141770 [Amborella trichopoda]